jgi:hypothetical protein
MKQCKIIIILAYFLAVQGCKFETVELKVEQRTDQSLNEAIKNGRKFFEKEEVILPFENINVLVYDEISAWEKRKTFGTNMAEDLITKLHSDGKKYWMIKYVPQKMVFGGVGVVFIDRNNGDIIDWYGEE